MEIEQLKLILETLQHTTDGAKDFGIWWIALHYGEKVLNGLFMVVCVCGIAWGVCKAILISSGSSEDTRRLQHLRDLMRVGSPGAVTDGEFDRMREKIRDWMHGENK